MNDAARQATRYDDISGRYDPWLLGVCVALASFGVVMVASASIYQASTPFYYLTRHLMFLGGGIVLALWAMRTELKDVEKHSQWLLLACFVLLGLVLLPGIGSSVKGARRWINLGISRFQVVEAVKVLYIVWLSSYLVRFRDEVSATWPAMIKPIGVVLMIVAFLLVQPDFGSSALLLAITGTMLVLGGVRLMRIAAPALILLPVMGWIAMSASYRVRRLTTFMDPWKDQQGDGYQLSNALMAIGRGEWTGVGLGASVQKLDYLPEVHTDFIFSVIAEELGFLGVCAVLALYATLVGRAFWIGYQCIAMRRHFAGYLAFGIGLWMGLQSIVSMGVNLGILPTKGLTLPLISSGGSSVLMTCLAMGILLRVSYELDRATRTVARTRAEGAVAGVGAATVPAGDAAETEGFGERIGEVVLPPLRELGRKVRERIEPTLGKIA